MNPDAPTEEDSERDGAFSYAAEWHAFTIGFYRGLTTYKPWSDDYDEIAEQFDDVAKEPWYYKGGYIFGTFAQLIFIVVLVVVWNWFSP